MIDQYCWLACGRMLELLPIKTVAVRVRTCSHSNFCHACLCRSPLQLLSCVYVLVPTATVVMRVCAGPHCNCCHACVCRSPLQLLSCVSVQVPTATVVLRVCAGPHCNCCLTCMYWSPLQLLTCVSVQLLPCVNKRVSTATVTMREYREYACLHGNSYHTCARMSSW